MTIDGYARVSTDGQGVESRVKPLRAAGADLVLKETASGAKINRTQLLIARSVNDFTDRH